MDKKKLLTAMSTCLIGALPLYAAAETPAYGSGEQAVGPSGSLLAITEDDLTDVRTIPEEEMKEIGNRFDAYAVARAEWFWPWTGSTVDIPTCWTGSKGQHLEIKEKIRLAIKATWEAESMVRFTGWGDCDDSVPFNPTDRYSHKGVRIGFTYTENASSYLGTVSSLRKPSLVLNPVPSSDPAHYASCGKPYGRSNEVCVTETAIHEFGHALAFTHEQRRPDTPNSCIYKDGSMPDQLAIGTWDVDSVMNYCSQVYLNAGKLSFIDRVAVKLLYDHFATATFTSRGSVITLPVVRYRGAYYEATLARTGTQQNYKIQSLVATTKRSSSPAVINDATMSLSIPIIGYSYDSANFYVAENVQMAFNWSNSSYWLSSAQLNGVSMPGFLAAIALRQ